MHRKEILPVFEQLPLILKHLPKSEEKELLIYGTPHRRMTVNLPSISPGKEESPSPVDLWIEENRTDPFIDLLRDLSIIYLSTDHQKGS